MRTKFFFSLAIALLFSFSSGVAHAKQAKIWKNPEPLVVTGKEPEKKDAEKTAIDPYKEAVVQAWRSGKDESEEIEAGPVLTEFDKLQAEENALKDQVNKAADDGDEALYNKLAPQYFATREKLKELFSTPEMNRLNQLSAFADKLTPLMNQKKWKEAHAFIMSSGMAEELGYEPPKESA